MHRLPLAATALAAALAATPPAVANVSCEFGGVVLNVKLSGPSARAVLTVAPDGTIVVADAAENPSACTGVAPTVTNTAAVSVVNEPGMSGTGVTIRRAGRFGPGPSAADENGGSPEIEFFVNFRDDPDSIVAVETDAAGGSLRFGDRGINPNATDAEVLPDADITVVSASRLAGVGGPEADALGAQGGRGTGNPLTSLVPMSGGAGPDVLVGGEGRDFLQGGAGDDRLFGLAGDDTLVPGTGEDSLDGGPGSDWADYLPSPAGITVDLVVLGPQANADGADLLADIENVGGTLFADVLRGDDGPNRLSGSGGNDVLVGRGGADRLAGGRGDDALDSRDGGADRAECGTETDSVIADPPGVDTLIECEIAAFPMPATGDGPAPPDTVAPAFLGRVRAVRCRPMTLRYVLSEAATVTFTVLRRNRRVRTFRADGEAGPNLRRLRLRRRGAYRVLLVAVDAAGNASRPGSVRFTAPKRRRHA